jgi:lipoate-protein ligase A
MLISTVLTNAFNTLGLKAYLSPGSPSHLSKSNNPCFSFPTPNELEIQGKKIVGSAQKRNKQALLQHGSIPISMNYDLYAAGTRSRVKIIKRSMTTLDEVSDKKKADLSQALVESFQAFIRQPMEQFEFNREEKKSIAEIERKYNSKEWNHQF